MTEQFVPRCTSFAPSYASSCDTSTGTCKDHTPTLAEENGEQLMPQTTGRSQWQLVGFQCTDEEYQQIVAAAEENESATSEWIRKVLKQAASCGKPSPVIRQ